MSGKNAVLKAAKKLYAEKLVAGTSGNISLRNIDGGEDSFYITPSGLSYDIMTEEDIVEIDSNGNPKINGKKPSSEWQMHLEIYKKYPNINAIVHTHSTIATGFAVNQQDIPLILIEMKPFLGGDIKVSPFRPAGSKELAEVIIPYLENRTACLLANHGVITVGKTMEEAFVAAEYVEDAAKIYYYAKTSGTPVIVGEDNTKIYLQHFLLDTNTAKAYAKEVLDYFPKDAHLECSEIGDGNINYVFKVWDKNTGLSLVIKQADIYLRSSGRPLDLYRNKIEAEILKLQGKLAKEYVPKVYNYDQYMYAISMEDISEYKNLRKELLIGKTFTNLASDITNFLANTLLPTTDLVMNRAEKKTYVKLFTNIELCDITEDLVFTEPYYDYKGRNIILDENKEFIERFLYSNDHLKKEVGILRDKFMNYAQALIHGDLHSGSIFINQKGLKVIDPEFAFYGPIGYDVGNVIGNLFFAWANKHYTEGNNIDFINWISETIKDIVDLFIEKINKKFDDIVTFDLYNNEFKEDYIKRILSDSFGFAGTEIIRRVVGDSKVLEVTLVDDIRNRVQMERALIKLGISLITNRDKFTVGKDIIDEFNLILI